MLFKLILKTSSRARLRSLLTIVGLVIAVIAFGLLRTVVDAWYAGSDMASANRLVTRNSISLTFTLPTYYTERIRAVDGVTGKSPASNWFAGIYLEPKNFFPQFAVTVPVFFDLYPEFLLPPEQMQAMLRDRTGCIIGRALAESYGWKIGDKIPPLKARSTRAPGSSPCAAFSTRATTPRVTRQMYFPLGLSERAGQAVASRGADRAGVFVVGIKDGQRAAELSAAIDNEFKIRSPRH